MKTLLIGLLMATSLSAFAETKSRTEKTEICISSNTQAQAYNRCKSHVNVLQMVSNSSAMITAFCEIWNPYAENSKGECTDGDAVLTVKVETKI